MTRALKDTLASYREAHGLIWQGRIWPVLIVPVILTVIYLPAMVLLGLACGQALVEPLRASLPWLQDDGRWVFWLVQGLMFLIFGIFAYFSFRIVVMLFYLPFLDAIIERAEKRLVGRSLEDPKRWYQMIVRMVLLALVTLTLTGALMLCQLLASFIPVVGTLVAVVALLPLQFFLTGVGYLDPYFDRNGYRVRASLAILGRRFPSVVAFEAVGSAMLLVPLVGWFLGPTYSVVAGVVMASRIEEGEQR